MAARTRTIKAWQYTTTWSDAIEWGTLFAATASKARYEALLWLRDSYDEITFKDILIRRAAHRDIHLPAPHRIVGELSEAEREIILHAYGYQGNRPEKAGYRDHYCTHPGDTRLLRLAWELDLFRGPFGDQDMTRSMWIGVFYYLTDLGKYVARSMLPDTDGAPI